MAETQLWMARSLSPVLYAGRPVLVSVGSIDVATLVGGTIGFENFTIFRYNGDVATAASVLVIGGFVFGFLSWFLARSEQLRTPTLRDHLRHCAALYVLLVTLAVPLVRMYESATTYGPSLGAGLAVAVFFTVGYAVCINALVLLLKRYRGHGELGGAR